MRERFDVGDIILERLKGRFSVSSREFAALKAAEEGDLFKVLVATIISQNTTEKNTFRAMQRLEEKIGIDPFKLASADVGEVAEAVSPAGLQLQKAVAIAAAARLIVEKYGGDIRRMLQRGEEAVREELGGLRGIGEKTVDVLLANSGFPVFPIDTHVRRVARRLGLSEASSYSKMREDLHAFFRPERRLEAHLLLIKLGREVCKPRKPLCPECPLNDLCKYAKSGSARR